VKRAAKDTGDETCRSAYPATDTGKKSRETKTGADPRNLTGEAGGILHHRKRQENYRWGRQDGLFRSPSPPRLPHSRVCLMKIATAKSSSEVWVNAESGAYHKVGRSYGATKQ
jgi:hypothetical protein